MKKVILILLFLILVLNSTIFLSKTWAEEEDLELVRKLKKEIQIINLVNGLYLDKEQMQFIFQQAREAKIIKAVLMARLKTMETQIVEAMGILKLELLKGVEATDPTKDKFQQINKEVETMKENYQRKKTQIANEVKTRLDGNQLYIIDTYKPCIIPPKGPGRIGQAEDTTFAEKHLEHIRSVPQDKFDFRKEELANKVIENARKHLPRGFIIDIQKEKERILEVFKQARSLPEVEFNLKKQDLVKQLKAQFSLPKLPIDISVKIDHFLLDEKIIPILAEKLKESPTPAIQGQ